MPKQIITSSKAPTTGFTPGGAVSPLAQAIRGDERNSVLGVAAQLRVNQDAHRVVLHLHAARRVVAVAHVPRAVEAAGWGGAV